MVYITSDLHGRKDAFDKLLEKIEFGTRDELFVLGDVLDRGAAPIPLLMQIMDAQNIHLLMGNHELYAVLLLEDVWRTQEGFDAAQREKLLIEWSVNGGFGTATQYKAQEEDTRRRIFQYLMGLPYLKTIERNGQRFVLAHSDMPALQDGATAYWANLKGTRRMDYYRAYCKDAILVSGHTPTSHVDVKCAGKIFKNQSHINVDCGARTLGCLCLDTMEEFYV